MLQHHHNSISTALALYIYAKQNTLGVKKCKANQKQHARRQARPKALISAEAKKIATLS